MTTARIVRTALAIGLALAAAPLAARTAPAPASASAQYTAPDMRPYVRLAVTGMVENYKNSQINKAGEVTDYGTLVERLRGEYSTGSGTIVTPEGLIVTNYHVIEDLLDTSLEYDDATKILTKFTPGRMLVGMIDPKDPLAPVVDKYVAKEVTWSKQRDIALMRIATDARTDEPVNRKDFPFAQLGNPYAIPVLAPLTVFGYPGKGGRSINPSSGPFQGYTFDVANALDGSIKTSAQIAGGNSGGAALYDGKLVAIPTRVSSKSEKGSDFGYLHPITWAALTFAYASLWGDYAIPNLELSWIESSHNTDVARTMSYGGGRIVAGQSRLPVKDATFIIFRADRTLEEIQNLRLSIEEVTRVMQVQTQLKDGVPAAKVAEALGLKVAQVRAYKDMKVDISKMSADVQAYDRDEFFFDTYDSEDDGWVFVVFPRGKAMNVAILKDGFKDWIGNVKPVTGLMSDFGKISIVMR